MFRFIFLLLITGSFSFILHAQISFPENSFAPVNSVYDEQNPVISPDGQTLFLTIRNHPDNIDGRRDPGDIWIASWMGDHWSAPFHAGNLLNDRGYNTVAGFSPDGSQLVLLHHHDASGMARTQGISVSRKVSGGWSKPENVFITYFQNRSSIVSGSLSFDGTVLVYSAETYGTHGVDDIYVTLRQPDGKWSEPRNLGSTINTQFQEISPSLSQDGNTLYFSTNGRKGFGSFDIYASTRLDDTYINWSEPVNLGPEINSEGRELFYRSYAHLGLVLYTSTRNSDGYGDVKVKITEARSDTAPLVVAPIITAPLVAAAPKPEVTDPTSIAVYGKVMNAKSGEGIVASLRFIDAVTTQEARSTISGYAGNLKRGQMYTVDVEATGYISKFEKLDLSEADMNRLELNFSLQPIEVGATVNLQSVLFKQSSPELLPESYPELDLIVEFMKANTGVEIELAGHTDNRGSYRQLMELSQKRVNRVKDYMVSKGIDRKRITGRGYGGSQPIASNDTEEQRMLNRRVEFIIRKR